MSPKASPAFKKLQIKFAEAQRQKKEWIDQKTKNWPEGFKQFWYDDDYDFKDLTPPEFTVEEQIKLCRMYTVRVQMDWHNLIFDWKRVSLRRTLAKHPDCSKKEWLEGANKLIRERAADVALHNDVMLLKRPEFDQHLRRMRIYRQFTHRYDLDGKIKWHRPLVEPKQETPSVEGTQTQQPSGNRGTQTKPSEKKGTQTKPSEKKGTQTHPSENQGTQTHPSENQGTQTQPPAFSQFVAGAQLNAKTSTQKINSQQ